MRYTYLFIALVVFTFMSLLTDKASGQNSQVATQNASFLTIHGHARSAATGKSLPYIHLSIPSRGIGTISNALGEFVFTIPLAYQNDSVKVSSVGYETYWFIPVKVNASSLLIILTEVITQLQPVVVQAVDPLSLIKQAIEQIPQNYASQPHRMRGSYQLTSKKYQDFIHISEAVFDLYYSGNGKQKPQFKLLKNRSVKDLTPFHGIENVVFGLKPESIFNYDLVHTIEESDILNRKQLKEYVFQLNGEVNYNGTPAYEITFDQKDGIQESLYAGKMYIEIQSLAFLSFTYWLSPKGIRYWKVKDLGQRALMSLMDIHEQVKRDSVQIEYQKWGNRYFLNRVSNNSVIGIKSDRYQFDFPAISRVEYVITDLDTNVMQSIPTEDLLSKNKYIESQFSDASEHFWKEYNILASDYDYIKVAQSIQLRNKVLNYKQEVENLLRQYSKDKVAQVDTVLSFYARKGLFNGSALIKYQGRTILSKGYGFANEQQKINNQPSTQFRIGSMAKSFTAMLILQLVEKGQMHLDDPVQKFVPEYIHPQITIRQLLSHQSGIPNYTNESHYIAEILTTSYSTSDIVKRFCSDSLEFTPGSRFSYSNSGYVLLACIIERVTQNSYGEVLNKMILRPLAMLHTFFGVHPSEEKMAKGYQFGKPELLYPLENVAGAGGITSTIEDLAIWDDALYTEKLLPKSRLESLFQHQAEYREWGGYYGLGWMMDRYLFKASKKHTIIYHPGTDFGFYSILVRQPDTQHTIILLNNKGDFPRFELTDILLNVLN